MHTLNDVEHNMVPDVLNDVERNMILDVGSMDHAVSKINVDSSYFLYGLNRQQFYTLVPILNR